MLMIVYPQEIMMVVLLLDLILVYMDLFPLIYLLTITEKIQKKKFNSFYSKRKLTTGSRGFSLHKAVNAFINVLLTFCSR
jgi:hypothetical protein